MHPQISVIVPIYKAEKYIHRCIDSILAQTFNDFELILVNDGSPDNCGAICDEYAARDSRIKVIHKKNGGVASARQCGMDYASGIYTIHADPDDWAEHNMLENLYNKAIEEDADMVLCDFWLKEKDIEIYQVQRPTTENAQVIIQDILFRKLYGCLWNKLIKLSCYKRHNITFTKGLNYCEDILICSKILINNIKVSYLNKAFYHYDLSCNSNSITKDYNIAIHNTLQLLNELQTILKEEKFSQAICYNQAWLAELAIKYPTLTSNEYKKIFKKQQKQILPHIKGWSMKVLFIASANGCKNFIYKTSIIVRRIKRSLKR